jgi:Uncharacterized protein with SCP/PR1 domains
MKKNILLHFIISILVLLPISLAFTASYANSALFDQPAEQIYNEAQTVYLGNLARRANGVAPLRWNVEMTEAARWFSWDSVENRTDPYCGHQDTQGNWPDNRIRYWGYRGFGGAENAYCGFVTPNQAIDGWMNSPGHRANLLDPNSREVGLGYYLRDRDGRGYVTQDFGVDSVFPPVIIENEAIYTESNQVGLYIYDRIAGGGFSELGSPTEMRISNEQCFESAAWEPFANEKTWTLEPGIGWRTVYVQTRDSLGRTSTVSDAIYLGAQAPLEELGYAQMSTHRNQVTLYGLQTDKLPEVQFSLSWRVDNTFSTFERLWGNGETVDDISAWGGKSYRMYSGDGESSAWVWTTEFIRDTPLIAYVRLKVSDNQSSDEVARISVLGTTLSLRGTDFLNPNQYQEFSIPITFPNSETFLIFQFWRSGMADVFVDTITFFSESQPVSNNMVWEVPGGNYSGQGILVRYTDGFDQYEDGIAFLSPSQLYVSPQEMVFLAELQQTSQLSMEVLIQKEGCLSDSWQAVVQAEWVSVQKVNHDRLLLTVSPANLTLGKHTTNITINLGGTDDLVIPVHLYVVDHIYNYWLPLVKR